MGAIYLLTAGKSKSKSKSKFRDMSFRILD